MTPEEFARLPRVSEATLSPDGAWMAVTVRRRNEEGARYISDLWRVPTDGSAPTPLTDGESNDRAPCFRSDGALTFLSDRQPEGEDSDSKHSQVWQLTDAGPIRLTDEALGSARLPGTARGW